VKTISLFLFFKILCFSYVNGQTITAIKKNHNRTPKQQTLYTDSVNGFSMLFPEWLEFTGGPGTDNQISLYFMDEELITGNVSIVCYPKDDFKNFIDFENKVLGEITSDTLVFSYTAISTTNVKWSVDLNNRKYLDCIYKSFSKKSMKASVYFFEALNKYIFIKLYCFEEDYNKLSQEFNLILSRFNLIGLK